MNKMNKSIFVLICLVCLIVLSLGLFVRMQLSGDAITSRNNAFAEKVNVVDGDGRDLQIQTGEYNIQMQFYWLDKNTNKYKVIDKNVDYIKK